MSTKVQPISGMEDTIQTTLTSTASSTVSPKVSLFTKKSGFVIPKNKLSGSLVPIFRGSKKVGGTDVENEESTKPVLRKTKWGPDLTQDAFVRKGRASAYQTRLDQITRQLKSGIMETRDDHDSPVAHGAAQESADRRNIENLELLELERREVIGEILKLNPTYKAPADYKPLLKEAKVAIPIKEYPGRNFVGIIFGPAGDTQKRLEKETGAKIRVYGIKADTKKEIEITSLDGNEAHGDCEELSVLVTAETYDKVDAAVSLIELLVTPVLANTVAVSTKDAGPGDTPNAVSLGQDALSYSISPMLVNRGVAQPFTGSGQAPAPSSAQFQPYPNQWLPTGQTSGFTPPPFPNLSVPMLRNPMQVSLSPSNSAAMPPLFGPRTIMSGAFGSAPNHPSLVPSQPQFQVPNMAYAGPPRNPSLPPLQIAPGKPNFPAPPTPTGPNQNMRPMGSPIPRSAPPYTFPERPLTSAGWSQPPAGSPGTLGPNMPQMMQPMVRPQASLSAISGGEPSPFRPSASLPPVAPPPPVGPQTGAPNAAPNSWFPSSTTSMSIPPPSIRPPPITALRPQQPSSNDFTFQTHHPQTPSSQQAPRPGSQPGSQFMPPRNPQVPPPQSPLFRPGMNNHGAPPPPIMQGFHRPQNSHQMGQHQGQSTMPPPPDRQPVFPGHGPRPPTAQMGSRQFGPGSPAGPFPPRPGNFGQVPQNHPSMGFRPQNLLGPSNQQFRGNVPPHSLGRPSGPQHIYDPFSPTAVPHKAGNPQNSRKQESDPEYDDLMASVGVK